MAATLPMNQFQIIQFDSVDKYIENLPEKERVKVHGSISALKKGDFGAVHIKQLKDSIRELIIKQHRLLFFQKDQVFYFVRAFRKKSMKTPKLEIEYAEKIYKDIP
jgi:phage-related protein